MGNILRLEETLYTMAENYILGKSSAVDQADGIVANVVEERKSDFMENFGPIGIG